MIVFKELLFGTLESRAHMNLGAPDPQTPRRTCRSDDQECQPAREGNVLLPETCETMTGDQFAAYMDLQQDGR